MVIATTVAADGNTSLDLPAQYSLRVAGGQYNPWQPDPGQSNHKQSNPWALPETPDSAEGHQQSPKYRSRQYPGNQYQGGQTYQYDQRFRFVTPEILESIKQQQTQTQLMPENKQNRQLIPQQSIKGYENPSYGMGYTNPLYDAPAVTPWGSGPDVLYRGESFPLLPNEATGGIPPIHISPFAEGYAPGESGNADSTDRRKKNKAFNPFTFSPN